MAQSTLRRELVAAIVGAAVIAGLYALSLQSYLVFHTTVELFSISVAVAMFMIAWNTRHAQQNDYVRVHGCGVRG